MRHDAIIGQTADVVNNFMQLNGEIKEVNAVLNKSVEAQLRLDQRVMLLMPYHRMGDFAIEHHLEQTTGQSIGSTAKGIKPAYIDEIEGRELRIFELADKDIFAKKVKANAEFWARKIHDLYGVNAELFREFVTRINKTEQRSKGKLVSEGILKPRDIDYSQFIAHSGVAFNTDNIIDAYYAIYESIKDCVTDLSKELHNTLLIMRKVLAEGAQGGVLDKTWAYGGNRTHSNTMASAISNSFGVPFQYINRVIGVMKAYGTAVGRHVMVSEIENIELSRKLKQFEFGATTGRQRDVYWLCLPEERITHRVNGSTEGVMNKLDLLSGADELNICVAFRDKKTGAVYQEAPPSLSVIKRCEPIYKTFNGWSEDITQCREFGDLPKAAQEYVQFYEDEIRKIRPEFIIRMIGVGPKRGDIVVKND